MRRLKVACNQQELPETRIESKSIGEKKYEKGLLLAYVPNYFFEVMQNGPLKEPATTAKLLVVIAIHLYA